MTGDVVEEQTWVVSAADISAEEGAVVGIAYDGESFPAMLSFYTEASGDQCVAPGTQLLALWPRSTPLSVVSRAGAVCVTADLLPSPLPSAACSGLRKRSLVCVATSARWCLSLAARRCF